MKSTGLLGGVQVFYILMSVVRNKLTALLIGAAGMGLADLYCRTLELLGNTTNFGIAFSAIRRLSALHDEGYYHEIAYYIRLIRTWTFLTALFGAVVCIALSPLISLLTTGSYAHALDYCFLAPAVAFTTLAGGEMAVLKGMRRLKWLALTSAASALGTVVIAVPLYAAFGMKGILPVIAGTTALNFLLNLYASSRQFPYRISPHRNHFLRQGGHLIKLGSAYIAAGIAASAAELFIRTIIVGSDSNYRMAGLYAAGLTLTVSYARLIFVAMDADYFPRLSASLNRRKTMNDTINQQIDILVLLMAPFLLCFAMMLPRIVPLLYSRHFMEIIPMILCALPYMFFKAIYSPIAYLPLASGKSKLYLFAELTYYVGFSIAVSLGYHFGGLTGAGIGLSLANLTDLLLLPLLYRRIFHFHFQRATLHRCALQGLFLLCGLGCCAITSPASLPSTAIFLLFSAAYSWHFLKQNTAILSKMNKLLHRKNKG